MSFLQREQRDHVLTLTMSSPETRNALTGAEQFDDFVQVCSEINDDMSIRAVVLTGAGSAFCAGGNVKDMRDRAGCLAAILLIRQRPTARVSSAFRAQYKASMRRLSPP